MKLNRNIFIFYSSLILQIIVVLSAIPITLRLAQFVMRQYETTETNANFSKVAKSHIEFEAIDSQCVFGLNNLSCSCRHNYLSTTCELFSQCTSQPCHYDGTCFQVDESNYYKCSCKQGLTDYHCETNINECLSNPCQLNSTCDDYINEFNCLCQNGTVGTYCETEIDECASNPCQYGGVCTDYLNYYECFCPAGVAGTNCQNETETLDKRIVGPIYYTLNITQACFYFIGVETAFCEEEKKYLHLMIYSFDMLKEERHLVKEVLNITTGKRLTHAFSKWHNAMFVATTDSTLFVIILPSFEVKCLTSELSSFLSHKKFNITQMIAVKDKLVLADVFNKKLLYHDGEFKSTDVKLESNYIQLFLVEFFSSFGFALIYYRTQFRAIGYDLQFKQQWINELSITRDQFEIREIESDYKTTSKDISTFQIDKRNSIGHFAATHEVEQDITLRIYELDGEVLKTGLKLAEENRKEHVVTQVIISDFYFFTRSLTGWYVANFAASCKKTCTHGSCMSVGAEFQCVCKRGYFGETCDSMKEHCNSESCAAAGTEQCSNAHNGFTCICKQGWHGTRCSHSDTCYSCTSACHRLPQNKSKCIDEAWHPFMNNKTQYTHGSATVIINATLIARRRHFYGAIDVVYAKSAFYVITYGFLLKFTTENVSILSAFKDTRSFHITYVEVDDIFYLMQSYTKGSSGRVSNPFYVYSETNEEGCIEMKEVLINVIAKQIYKPYVWHNKICFVTMPQSGAEKYHVYCGNKTSVFTIMSQIIWLQQTDNSLVWYRTSENQFKFYYNEISIEFYSSLIETKSREWYVTDLVCENNTCLYLLCDRTVAGSNEDNVTCIVVDVHRDQILLELVLLKSPQLFAFQVHFAFLKDGLVVNYNERVIIYSFADFQHYKADSKHANSIHLQSPECNYYMMLVKIKEDQKCVKHRITRKYLSMCKDIRYRRIHGKVEDDGWDD